MLNTINKRNKLNTVVPVGDKGNGNSHHEYQVIFGDIATGKEGVVLQFQDGGRGLEGSVDGLTIEDLLEICRHRLQSFQTSEYACRENAIALTSIEQALLWLNYRAEDRVERGVFGTITK